MNKFLITIGTAFTIFVLAMLMNETHNLRYKMDSMIQEKDAMVNTIKDLEETLVDMRKKKK